MGSSSICERLLLWSRTILTELLAGSNPSVLQRDSATLEQAGMTTRTKVLLIGTEDGQRDTFQREETAIVRRDQARDAARERQRRRRGSNVIKLAGALRLAMLALHLLLMYGISKIDRYCSVLVSILHRVNTRSISWHSRRSVVPQN